MRDLVGGVGRGRSRARQGLAGEFGAGEWEERRRWLRFYVRLERRSPRGVCAPGGERGEAERRRDGKGRRELRSALFPPREAVAVEVTRRGELAEYPETASSRRRLRPARALRTRRSSAENSSGWGRGWRRARRRVSGGGGFRDRIGAAGRCFARRGRPCGWRRCRRRSRG